MRKSFPSKILRIRQIVHSFDKSGLGNRLTTRLFPQKMNDSAVLNSLRNTIRYWHSIYFFK